MEPRPTTRTSRRALLAAAGGAAAALAAESLARPLPALATDNSPMLCGKANFATNQTNIQVLEPAGEGSNIAFAVVHAPVPGTMALSAGGYDGIWAWGDRAGISAHGQVAVEGVAKGQGGLAIKALGMVSFSTAGFGVVPIGKTFVTIMPPHANGEQLDPNTSKVLVTLLSDPKGVQVSYVKINPAVPLNVRASFTVYLTAAAKSNLRFAYLVFS